MALIKGVGRYIPQEKIRKRDLSKREGKP